MSDKHDFTLSGNITKLDNDQRVCWGWSSVTVDKGKPVVDLQGDIIETDDLQKAVWEFMSSDRVSATMHGRDASGKPVRTGTVVDSIVITADLGKALGLEPGREGWFVGVKVDDPEVWAGVKDGTYSMFSIGGKAEYEAVE
jgi:Putative phage serine protease XkdF